MCVCVKHAKLYSDLLSAVKKLEKEKEKAGGEVVVCVGGEMKAVVSLLGELNVNFSIIYITRNGRYYHTPMPMLKRYGCLIKYKINLTETLRIYAFITDRKLCCFTLEIDRELEECLFKSKMAICSGCEPSEQPGSFKHFSSSKFARAVFRRRAEHQSITPVLLMTTTGHRSPSRWTCK